LLAVAVNAAKTEELTSDAPPSPAPTTTSVLIAMLDADFAAKPVNERNMIFPAFSLSYELLTILEGKAVI
jgi:hypothetical protein